MKKLSKLMALLLSLLMILSLFAACGDDKKDNDDKEDSSVSDEKDKDEDDKDKEDKKDEEETVSAEDTLIGEWETKVEYEGIALNLSLIFDEDGTAYFDLSEENFDKMVDEIVTMQMEEITDEEIAEEGFESREEAKEYVREMMLEEFSYDFFVESYIPDVAYTWELDGDTLTVESEDGAISTAETKLSKGKTTFTLIDEEGGIETKLTKVK